MLDNKYRREHVLPLYRSEANRTIEGLKFYLETLESFIETKREGEISNLQKKVEHLSEDDQGEFWAWRYPIHWDDIFVTHLRASFIVTLMSLAEFHLNIVAEQASEIASTPLKARDLRGSSFEKDRKLLEALAGFRRPSTDTWNSLHEVREIRNCIVHADSTIYRSHNEVRLKSLVAKLPGLSTTHGLIEMSNEFPQHCLVVIKNFLTDLYEEASDMCQKFV